MMTKALEIASLSQSPTAVARHSGSKSIPKTTLALDSCPILELSLQLQGLKVAIAYSIAENDTLVNFDSNCL
jgi:hypothetical protein